MKFSEVTGVIFDVDDTLLSNYPPEISCGLHEHSRLLAVQQVGERLGKSVLQQMTEEQSRDAFRRSKVHTLEGGVWQMLLMAGEVSGEDIDHAHPLLVEISCLKNELHEQVLRDHGREVPGATAFVQTLAKNGLADRLAVASTAVRRDIDLFFDMADLHQYFPPERIVSKEQFTHPKPHPEAFEQAFKRLGLKNKKGIIIFEDDPRGITSANAAGLFTCAITTRFSREELAAADVPPDLIADNYAEFARHLGLPLDK